MHAISVYSADRYVIACRSPSGTAKVFQLAFARSDASLFVALPYLGDVPGRVGLVTLNGDMSFPADITIGEDFPVTSHSVKYSHHPRGRAHFSLSGKVRASVGKEAVPLNEANGHLFTVMAQGLQKFDPIQPADLRNRKRGVIQFGFKERLPVATKFTAFLYSESECARRVQPGDGRPWVLVAASTGEPRLGILLATPYQHAGQRYFLMLVVEELPLICTQQEVWLSLLGGFDPPSHAFDHGRPTSFLMCIYPASDRLDVLVKQVGTIDLPSQP